MRRLIIAAAAFAALASAGSLAGTTAQAMPLSGLSDQATSSVVPVYQKCGWRYDSYGYRTWQCWEVYYAPPQRTYYPPPQRYYGGGGGGGY
jgi:hypothetical protein